MNLSMAFDTEVITFLWAAPIFFGLWLLYRLNITPAIRSTPAIDLN